MEFIQTYKEVLKTKTNTPRGFFRDIALDILSLRNSIIGIDAYLNKPRIQVLFIHHIFKDEERPLEILIEKLKENHEFISYSEAVEKILQGKIDKPYIVFASDDGFKNNIRAAEIFNKHGVKACFFVPLNIVGETNPQKLNYLSKEVFHFPIVGFLNWDDIVYLQKLGHEIGAHTLNHVNIAKLSKTEMLEDCSKSIEILKKHCGEAKHFAAPYGRYTDFNETARQVVFESGFLSCALAERGCHINHNVELKRDELCILRDVIILYWKLQHIMYFLANNSKKVKTTNNLFPYKNYL